MADGQVWFSGGGSRDGERARLTALIRIDEELRSLGAHAQTRALICPSHAQWRFRPGRHHPEDLVVTVGRIIDELDPGDWRVKADRC